ncbi:MAG: RidA family protein [Desulfocapsaceae bacterium]|jgi:2-iminobutanoate/2-iminopropanoate deaminase
MKQIVTDKAPAAFGPFSQAIAANGMVFTSGALPIAPETGALVDGGIEKQTHQTLKNLQAVVEAAGTSMEKIVQVVIYLTDMKDFHKMNEVYASYFDEHLPARATVGVAALAKGALVEIQAIAAV